MTETEIFKAIESQYGSGILMAFADLIESENMNTYNTYQEAKIANPESEIVTRDGEFNASDMVTQLWPARGQESVWVRCNPANYCMTVEQFLKDNGELPDGALILHPDGSHNVLIDNTMKDICSNGSYSFVVELPTLELPKQEVEWKNGDECIYQGQLYVYQCVASWDSEACVLSGKSRNSDSLTDAWIDELSKPECTKQEYVECEFSREWEAVKFYNETGELFVKDCTGAITNVNNMPDDWFVVICRNYQNLYKKVEVEITERELVIEQAENLTGEYGLPIFGELYDLGMLKLSEK